MRGRCRWIHILSPKHFTPDVGRHRSLKSLHHHHHPDHPDDPSPPSDNYDSQQSSGKVKRCSIRLLPTDWSQPGQGGRDLENIKVKDRCSASQIQSKITFQTHFN